jgi:hypothetical protein
LRHLKLSSEVIGIFPRKPIRKMGGSSAYK